MGQISHLVYKVQAFRSMLARFDER
jgi:hypothetical protein